jgi:hypothetical protein
MTKLLALLIGLALPALADGPKYNFTDPKLNAELDNVYYDIRNVGNKGTTLGRFKQLVQGTATANFSTNSTSFGNSSLEVAITPSSTNSRVFVMACGSLYNDTAGQSTYLTIARNTTNLMGANGGARLLAVSAGQLSPACVMYFDTPASTSAITYRAQARVSGGGSTGIFGETDTLTQVMIAVEIL